MSATFTTRLTVDGQSLLDLLLALAPLLDRSEEEVSTVKALLERPLGELFELRVVDGGAAAAGAGDLVLRLEPSQLFADFLATVPAFEGDALLLDVPLHNPDSFVGSVARPTIERQDAAVTAAASALPSQQIS